MCRYELPQPGAAQKNDVAAWQESVDNSMAQLEHQAGRCGLSILWLVFMVKIIYLSVSTHSWAMGWADYTSVIYMYVL